MMKRNLPSPRFLHPASLLQFVLYGWARELKACWGSRLVQGVPSNKEYTQDIRPDNSSSIDSVVIARWPDGHESNIDALPADAHEALTMKRLARCTPSSSAPNKKIKQTPDGMSIKVKSKKDRFPIWYVELNHQAKVQICQDAIKGDASKARGISEEIAKQAQRWHHGNPGCIDH